MLLVKNRGLVKSVRFKDPKYIGDPINAVRIFNELKADELVFLDIEASEQNRLISLDLVRNVGEEACMPFSVGGGIRSIGDIRSLIATGAEKVVINTAAGRDPEFIRRAADRFGSSTIVVCIDVKRKLLGGKRSWVLGGSESTRYEPVEFAQILAENGAGELILQSIDRDGTMDGYDIELIRSVSTVVDIPVIALGGAGQSADLVKAFRSGHANALAAGSLFVFRDKRRGVLINYPDKSELAFDL